VDDPQAAWRRAASFEDLCALGERFVRGTLESFPGWGAPDLDVESDSLIAVLGACMAGGFLTTASQPGRPFAPGHAGRAFAQRAFVCGFVSPRVASRLAEEAATRHLWFAASHAEAAAHAATAGPGFGVQPVGLADGTPYLFAGHPAADEELALFEDHLAPRALSALALQPFVWLVDPVWGRRDALPEGLAAVLRGARA